jgi:TonB family protein
MTQSIYRLHEPLRQQRIYAIALSLAAHIAVITWFTAYLPNNDLLADYYVDATVPVEFIMPIEPVNPERSSTRSTKQKTQAMPSKSTPELPTKILKDIIIPANEHDSASTETTESTTMMIGETAVADDLGLGSEIGGDGNGDSNDESPIKILNLKPKYSPPPDYPRLSSHNAEEGVVILLVKVGVDGIPIEAKILKSSGFPDLDENTRQNILARWQFYPAIREGVPIPAYVLAKQIYVMHGQSN